MTPSFTEPTTGYWQTIEAFVDPAQQMSPFRLAYPARLPDGRWLRLPIRQRPDGLTAVASFIANQASLPVLDTLAGFMAEQVRGLQADVIVGLPTLGLALAAPLAHHLGQQRFVPFGTSRKFWYDEALSQPASSITTSAARRLYVDPNLVALLAGRRVLLVDDTISSGTTAVAALGVLATVGAEVVGLAFAMGQGSAWRTLLPAAMAERVTTVFRSPHLAWTAEGWVET